MHYCAQHQRMELAACTNWRRPISEGFQTLSLWECLCNYFKVIDKIWVADNTVVLGIFCIWLLKLKTTDSNEVYYHSYLSILDQCNSIAVLYEDLYFTYQILMNFRILDIEPSFEKCSFTFGKEGHKFIPVSVIVCSATVSSLIKFFIVIFYH